MSAPALRVAVLPRGLDGLYLGPIEGVEVHPLVRRGSPEDAWISSFFEPSRVLRYEVPGGDPGIYPPTGELLEASTCHLALRQAQVNDLLLGASCSPRSWAWSQRHGVRLLMTAYEQQRRLEDKRWFDAFARRHGLPVPAGGMVTVGQTREGAAARAALDGPCVLQEPDSMGGEGTHFLRDRGDIDELCRRGVLRRGQRYLARRFIEGRPFGVTVLVVPGLVALSAARVQCYYPPEPGRAGLDFAGVQWVPSAGLSPRLRGRIDEVLLRLGALLYRRRFHGFANVDFMVDGGDEIFLLECNPRLSAATPQLLLRPELLSGVAAGAEFLRGFTGERVFSPRPAHRPLPTTDFAGATLDLIHRGPPGVVRRGFASGLYGPDLGYLGPDLRRPAAGQIALFSFGHPGQPCEPGATVGSLLSSARLHDPGGKPLTLAHSLQSHFAYTDGRQGHRRGTAAG